MQRSDRISFYFICKSFSLNWLPFSAVVFSGHENSAAFEQKIGELRDAWQELKDALKDRKDRYENDLVTYSGTFFTCLWFQTGWKWESSSIPVWLWRGRGLDEWTRTLHDAGKRCSFFLQENQQTQIGSWLIGWTRQGWVLYSQPDQEARTLAVRYRQVCRYHSKSGGEGTEIRWWAQST